MKRDLAFLATVYHDEPENANTESAGKMLPSLKLAVRWAQHKMETEPHWNGYPSTVHRGLVVLDDGPLKYWLDDDNEAPWLVYADRVERDG